MQLQSGQRFGPYEIVERVGAGGMGEVYRAQDTRLSRYVAIKILRGALRDDPRLRARFDREAKTISALSDPHICALHDIGSHNGVDYLVLEYCDGITLAQRLDRGPLAIEQVLQYGNEIATALSRAHRAGIIHRDLKPSNIMLTKSGVKLLDFGLAKPAMIRTRGEATGTTSLYEPISEEGSFLGTIQYMAPEVLAGKEADARTDIFTLGVVLYEMLTGKPAFSGTSTPSIMASILEREPQPIRELQPQTPPALEHIISKSLAKNPDERWESAHDIAEELRWISQTLAGPTSIANVWAERFAWKWLAVGVALIVALLVAAAVITPRFTRENTASEQISRSELLPPPGHTLIGVAFGSIALSPDATKLAMVLAQAGESVIAIRDLSSGETRKLAGTDGATFPFWSPDGTRLAFFADRKLKTIGAGGTAVEVLSDAVQGRGGAWSSQGLIVFSPNTEGPLFKVAEGGGAPVAVTHPPAGWSHRNPTFLPDAKGFLFVARARSSGDSGVELHAGSLDGKGDKRLLENASNASVAGDHLLFVRNGNLLAQRFDSSRLMVSGTPSAIADRVEYFAIRGLANFSCARATIAYVPEYIRPPQQLVMYDSAGATSPVGVPPADYEVLDVSPDGRTVAVMTGVQKEDADISLIQIDRATPMRLTFLNARMITAAFSPDGKELAYAARYLTDTKIVRKSLGSNETEAVIQVPAYVTISGWSADARYLLITHQSTDTAHDVGFVDMTDRKMVLLARSPALEFAPALSPNQKWLAYVSTESGALQIYVMRFPSGTGKWQVTLNGGFAPRWSHDGKELFYISQNRLHRVRFEEAAGPEFGQPEALFTMPSDTAAQYVVTSEGRFLTTRPAGDAPHRVVHLIRNWTKLLTHE